MDTDQEDTRLAELREALRRRADPAPERDPESINLDQLTLDFDWISTLADDTIPSLTTEHISALDWQSIQHPILGGGGGSYTGSAGAPFTIANGGGGTYTLPDFNVGSSKITLDGEDADIEINGESVVGMLRDIRDRLAILQVSEEMEQEWQELRDLRRQYETKLAECREKSAMWKSLKDLPPPEIT